jgi:hypothetical protein
MTVYVLFADFEYDGCPCLGVYASLEAAEAAWDSYESGGECLIQERVLGAAPAEEWR